MQTCSLIVTGGGFSASLVLGSLFLQVWTEDSRKTVASFLQGNCCGTSVTEGAIRVPGTSVVRLFKLH